MPVEKPARFIEKLIAQAKADAKTIAALTAKIANHPREVENAVRVAVAAKDDEIEFARTQHDAERDETARIIERLREERYSLAQQRDIANAKCFALYEEKGKLANELAGARTELHMLAHVAEQRAELQRLCDGVRDRMKRREREEEQAILNRGALVGVVARPNRGPR